MSVVAEFMLSADAFAFGDALLTDPPMKIVLERIVPGEENTTVYIWASQGDFEALETSASSAEPIFEFVELDAVGDRRLYRVGWQPNGTDLIRAIQGTEGVVLQASGAGTWTFQIRFPDHERLGDFYAEISAQNIDLNVDAVQVLAAQSNNGDELDLTIEQREALTLAVRRGYYKVPRDAKLSTIADELGVSNQAASERLRRGSARVFRPMLLGEE